MRLFAKRQCEKFATIPYQLFAILLSLTFIILTSFLGPVYHFNCTDPTPIVYPFTPQAAEKFGLNVKSVVVETGLSIENFQTFNINDGNFIMTGFVWFKFDPAITSLDTIEKFSFARTDKYEVSKVETKLINNRMFAQYRIKLKFTSGLDYSLFPVDDHKIFVFFMNKFVSPKEIMFSATEANLNLAKGLDAPGWGVKGHSVSVGYLEEILDRHDQSTTVYNPVVLYEIDFGRVGWRVLFGFIFPMFLIFCLSCFALSFTGKDRLSMGLPLSLGEIPAMIGYRFVIEGISPRVGYFMIIDHIFNTFFLLCFLILFFHLITVKHDIAWLRGLMIPLVHGLFMLSWFYFMYYIPLNSI